MSTTTHPYTREEVMAYLDGELLPDNSKSISVHIQSCAECQAVKEAFEAASHKLAAWKVRLNESAFLAEAGKIASQRRTTSAVSHLWDWLPRRRAWVPALSLVIATSVLVGAFTVRSVRKREASQNGFKELKSEKRSSAALYLNLEKDEAKALPPPPLTRSVPAEVGTRQGRAIELETRLSAPMIARTVSLSIVVKEFEVSHTALDAILTRHDGYAASLNVSTPQGAARDMQASLRIPAPQLASVVAELKTLGRVEAESQNGEEVTQTHADLVARLKNSRETERSLQDVLRTRAGKVKDVLEVEEEIARVRGEIEEMEAEQKTLEHRVDFATIDLKLSEEYKAQLSSPAPSVGTQFRNSSVTGFRKAFESLMALILFLAEAGPTLLLWLAILATPTWLLWRRYRRSLATASAMGA